MPTPAADTARDTGRPGPDGEVRYTIRRKVLAILGAKFHVYDEAGELVGFSKMKAFKLKEDIRVFRDESMSEEWIRIAARSVIDFSASYDVTDSRTGDRLGTLRRKGLKSLLRDSWELLDADEHVVGHIEEDSALLATLRRLADDYSFLFPQTFSLKDDAGRTLATYKNNFNPFVHKLGVVVEPDCPLHPFVPLAAGILLVAIEGKQ